MDGQNTSFSRRSSTSLIPNAFTVKLDALRASGRPLIDLTLSNPTQAELPSSGEAALHAMADPRSLVYQPSPQGLLTAREAIAARWLDHRPRGPAQTPTPDQVFITASTSEAYAFLFKLLCDPGDAVMLFTPGYPLFELLATIEGVRPIFCPLAFDGQWHLDRGAVLERLGPDVRALVVVSPVNPTGHYLSAEDLAWLADLGRPIISDEVFAPYPHPGVERDLADPQRPVATALEAAGPDSPLIVALGGLSKQVGLPQMKAGWMIIDGPARQVEIARARLMLIADTFLSVSTPVQWALPTLLESGQRTADAIRARVRDHLKRLDAALGSTAPISRLPVQAGWYACLRLPAIMSDEVWALRLLEAGVRVHPGHFYDFPLEPVIVISLLTPTPAFEAGISALMNEVQQALGPA